MHWILADGFRMVGLAGFLVTLFVVAMLVRLLPYRSGLRSEFVPAKSPQREFSPQRYAPMARLLAAEDFEFLASQPGYRPEIASRLKQRRRRVFRMYLCELAGDFHRLHGRARKMVAESGEEQAQFVGVLMRQQLAFWRTMFAIEFRMMTPGLAVGMEIRNLVQGIEAMQNDLARLRMPAAA